MTTSPSPTHPVTEMQGHTPTPWAATEIDNFGIWHINRGKIDNGGVIATLWGLDDRGAGNAQLIVEAVNSHASLKARVEELEKALENIAGWRKVNISGEYEHGLRDIIRSMVDCAATALEVRADEP